MELAQLRSTAIKSGKRPSVLPAVLMVVVVAATVTAFQLAGTVTRSAGDTRYPFADTSYDRVEAVRGARSLATGAADTSYDQVERIRAIGQAGR